MMYQRDMCLTFEFLSAGGGEVAEQELDHARESSSDAEEEEGEQKRHDDHHDARRDRFLAGRPVHLRRFGADLTDEFAGGNFRHDCSALLRIEKGSAGTAASGAWGHLAAAG